MFRPQIPEYGIIEVHHFALRITQLKRFSNEKLLTFGSSLPSLYSFSKILVARLLTGVPWEVMT